MFKLVLDLTFDELQYMRYQYDDMTSKEEEYYCNSVNTSEVSHSIKDKVHNLAARFRTPPKPDPNSVWQAIQGSCSNGVK